MGSATDLPGAIASISVRAHLLEMAGDDQAAIDLYRRAAQRTTNLPEQRYLATRAARLRARGTDED